ncbi:MAG TPA: 3-phosphoserine/phosphohydroxythreonine transaminase, partial [Candidatus Kapabacteria bacterium]|nr:3-phosphoserine/phosphohydroxythreonine transaminase [Candidatus Kapabacteria bacterium]
INKANYVLTGVWAKKAAKEAKFVGNTNIIASSEDKNFNYIPKNIQVEQDADYVHITTNNTIYGTEYKENHIPDVGNVPLVADMSSDLFALRRDFSKYHLIYAGAQKNIGPAGVTMVVIKKSWLEKGRKELPTMINYETHIKEASMFNTPPCFPVYVVGRTFKWILKQGLEAIEENNYKKANLLYDFMDANSDFYKPTVTDKEDRSLMNVTFNLNTPELESKFIEEAKKRHNMTNLKGHRSVGGVRASIYNACPIEWVEALVRFMEEFMKENK